MGQYKVPQDVEAEDKLIGPLTLRQFLYLVAALAWAGLMWRVVGTSSTTAIIIMVVLIIPVSGFFVLLGVGRRQEQSFENYFVAVVRFMVVPRIRSWQKDISTDMIVRAEPKKVEVVTEKNVPAGSLQQLALIIDTRGSYKDPSIQLQDETNQAVAYSGRILDPTQVAPVAERPRTQVVTTQDDVLDEQSKRNNQVGELLENVETNIREQAVKNVQKKIKTPSTAAATASQPQISDDILKKAMLQSNNLSVEQMARQASQGTLAEGQEVSISPNPA